jgi:hypothetical protein
MMAVAASKATANRKPPQKRNMPRNMQAARQLFET